LGKFDLLGDTGAVAVNQQFDDLAMVAVEEVGEVIEIHFLSIRFQD
jgi:hypothetical protein